MLKRIITIAFAAIVSTTTILAQEVKKPRLLIENFGCADGLSNDLRDMLRMNVISAINLTERFEVMDANTQAILDQESTRRASESAMADRTARTGIITTKANNYILRGSLLTLTTQSSIVDGKTRYTYSLGYSITLIDVDNSKDIASETFSHGTGGVQNIIGGTGGKILNQLSTYASEADAINGGLSCIKNDIVNFLIKYLPLEGEVIAEDYEVKKDKIEACYINIGSGLGVKVGDYFAILVAQVRAGRTIYQEIGRLKIKEVLDETLSYCDVTKGNKVVYEMMEEYKTMLADDPNTLPIIVRLTKGSVF